MVVEGGSPGRVWTYSGSMQWCGRRGGGSALPLVCDPYIALPRITSG